MNNDNSFFIIIGRGRSGTTLLSKILNSNPSISIPGELFIIINLFNKYYAKEINKKIIKNFTTDVFFEKRLKNKNFSKIELEKYLIQKSPKNYEDLCLATYENLAIQQGKKNIKLLGDKHSYYSLFIANILEIFDNVKFIHIVRDYRDNVLSYKNVNFDMNNLYALAYRWKFFNKKILKYSKIYPDKFLLLKYENLISNSEKEIKQICKFLNIDFTPDMLEFHLNKSENLSFWHKNLNSKLNSDNINKWEKELNKKQIDKIDFICNDVANKLGYKEKIRFNLKLYFSTIVPVIYAKTHTYSEIFLFKIPFGIRARVINLIRKFQKTN